MSCEYKFPALHDNGQHNKRLALVKTYLLCISAYHIPNYNAGSDKQHDNYTFITSTSVVPNLRQLAHLSCQQTIVEAADKYRPGPPIYVYWYHTRSFSDPLNMALHHGHDHGLADLLR